MPHLIFGGKASFLSEMYTCAHTDRDILNSPERAGDCDLAHIPLRVFPLTSEVHYVERFGLL